MLSFSYTTSLQLRETIHRIDQLRTRILTLPISPKTETKLVWEAMAIRTWATLALADIELPKHQVATILANATKPTRATAIIYAQRNCYEYIHENWRANPRPITVGVAETLFSLIHGDGARFHAHFSAMESGIRELLTYIDAKSEHPVIQSAIIHMQLLARAPEIVPQYDESGLFARVLAYAFLSKYGYDMRGFVAPDRVWESDARTYTHLKNRYLADGKLTTWMEYIADSFLISLQTLVSDIEDSRFYIDYPAGFWELSDRQKEILKLLANPEARITNRQVHARFRVSQITASRDLAKLVSLGLLYPHGKGRSIYYTKI